MRQTLVSVIIPVFNGEAYIAQAIDSVLNQTYQWWELIVIDDGSTDATRPVLQPYRDRLEYVRQENEGVSAARNHGLRLARGEYVVFLDADDMLLKEKLTEQVACLDEDQTQGCVHSGWHVVGSEGELLRTVEPWLNAPRLDLESWLTWCPYHLGALMFRRAWLEEAGGFDPTLRQAEDVDLLLRLSLMGCSTSWLRKPTMCYRQHQASTMRDGIQQAECITRVMTSFFARPDRPKQLDVLEDHILFNTAMWSAWHLYVTGYTSQIARYLRASMAHRPESPTQILRIWLEHFARGSVDKGHALKELRVLWPQFREAIQAESAAWPELEQTLERWLKCMMVLYSTPRTRGTERA